MTEPQTEEDFISSELRARQSVHRADVYSRRAWLTSLAAVVVAIAILLTMSRGSTHAQMELQLGLALETLGDVRTRLSVLETITARQSIIDVQEWQSTSFASGSADCGPYPGPGGQEQPDPCTTWNVINARPQSKPSDLIAQEGSGGVIVIVVGGHDRNPLAGQLRDHFGSNSQLAQRRADVVAAILTPERSTPLVKVIALARGASDVLKAQGDDRSVMVTLIRLKTVP